MKTLMNIQVKDKEDALKYVYAFMKCKQLNMKEYSFTNHSLTKFDTKYIIPRGLGFFSYDGENMPTWEIFKANQLNISSPAFTCTACIDREDKRRVGCFSLGEDISLNIYGDYEKEAKEIFDNIMLSHSSL